MIKKFFNKIYFPLTGVMLVICGCVSLDKNIPADGAALSRENGLRWFSPPNPDSLVIFGVSGPQIRRETEIDNARAHAARRVALYHGVLVSNDIVQSTGSGFLNFFTDQNISFEYDENFEKYMDGLVFDPERDVFFVDGAVFVRFTYPVVFPGILNHSPGLTREGRPEWVNRPPNRIGGFYSGVGFSGRQVRMRDTVVRSYESAMVSIASQIHSDIVSEDTSAGYHSQTVIQKQSRANLSNFTVLEIWIDPENLAVWTLAVALNADS